MRSAKAKRSVEAAGSLTVDELLATATATGAPANRGCTVSTAAQHSIKSVAIYVKILVLSSKYGRNAGRPQGPLSAIANDPDCRAFQFQERRHDIVSRIQRKNDGLTIMRPFLGGEKT